MYQAPGHVPEGEFGKRVLPRNWNIFHHRFFRGRLKLRKKVENQQGVNDTSDVMETPGRGTRRRKRRRGRKQIF